ncbi:hypothetical protein BV898_03914 [Hypsibius exemplaris]|uniref:Uncharacterized protein n=1 Tax=Hypsibius exemplaris TaxID=2072580 RepID=A0A1W0X3R3_HYPEX|nr:hypothetical protein BV898_03914 [Hypsibius exemplaris]
MEWNGTERNGTEMKGTEWNGTTRNGNERNGMERDDTERDGTARNGTEMKGNERNGGKKEYTTRAQRSKSRYKCVPIYRTTEILKKVSAACGPSILFIVCSYRRERIKAIRMKTMGTSRRRHCLGGLPLLPLLTLLTVAVRRTEAHAAAGHSDSLFTSLVHPRQTRQVTYSSQPLALATSTNRKAVADYSTGGYAVPNGATPVQQLSRNYSPYGSNVGTYSAGAYNPSSYSSSPYYYNTAPASSSYNPSYNYNPSLFSAASRSLYNTQQPQQQQYQYQPSARSNIAPADPSEPEDPDTDSSSTGSKKQQQQFVSLSLPNAPNFGNMGNGVQQQQNGNALLPPSAAALTGVASQLSGSSASALSAFSSRGLGGASGYGVGNNYAAASVPDGATYSGPATASSGSDGYAQNSPNTATGSLYNKDYAKPSFYGKTAGGGAGISPALLYPFFLYYPVSYGYDQGEQSVMPTGGYFPLIGYKRRYGYRNGPYYGYGIYVDYPPYFGFGKVKDGFGSDPEADAMAAVALQQGSGASEALNSGAGQSSGYGNPGSSGYANQGGYGGQQYTGTSGYGTQGASASTGYGGQSGVSGYGGQAGQTAGYGGQSYASPVSGYNSNQPQQQSYGSSQQQQYPSQRSYIPSASAYVQPAASSLPVSTAAGQASQLLGSSLLQSRSYIPSSSSSSSFNSRVPYGLQQQQYAAPRSSVYGGTSLTNEG